MTLRTLIVDDEAPGAAAHPAAARRRTRRHRRRRVRRRGVGAGGDRGDAAGSRVPRRADAGARRLRRRAGAAAEASCPAIVFVTAYDRYALRAFDVHAIDYLLKPFTRERFRTALARARERIASARRRIRRSRASPRTLRRRAGSPVARGGADGGRTVFVDWRRSTGSRRPTTTSRCTSARASTWCARRWRRSKRSSIRSGSRASTDRPSSRSIASPSSARPRTATREVVLRDGTTLVVSRTWRHGFLKPRDGLQAEDTSTKITRNAFVIFVISGICADRGPSQRIGTGASACERTARRA